MGADPFFGAMAGGILISFLIGAVIGLISPNQSAATSVTVPVMMVVSFLPMLSMFNRTIAGIAKFTYTGQLHRLISGTQQGFKPVFFFAVLLVNALIAGGGFLIVYKRSFFSGK